MLVTYIARIRGKLNNLIAENFNLFDKMHEGLIIISQKDYSLKFASRPATALLKQLPQTDALKNEDYSLEQSESKIDENDLSKTIFMTS